MSTLDDLEARVDSIEEQLQEMATFGYGETSGADLAEYNVDSQDSEHWTTQVSQLWDAFKVALALVIPDDVDGGFTGQINSPTEGAAIFEIELDLKGWTSNV